MLKDIFFRLIGAIALGVAGWRGSIVLGPTTAELWWGILLALLGAGLGFAIAPYLTTHPWRWSQGRIEQIPAHVFLAATIGLVVGLAISALLALPLSLLPDLWGKVVAPVLGLVVTYISVSIMVLRGRDILPLFTTTPPAPRGREREEQIILDTNAIIDGRIADISQAGFVPGTLVIPRFVLDELRHIADSPDPLRRNRGRRGLDMLTKLQKESDVPIQISDADFEDTREVDAKLLKLAKALRCPIITNDFNLTRVAELQGVRVLNINELANVVKPVVLPGEEMTLRIIQEGKEAGQGVGFLEDGTMVVVEGGKRYLSNQLGIVITRVLQTAAGRMIFATPKDGK